MESINLIPVLCEENRYLKMKIQQLEGEIKSLATDLARVDSSRKLSIEDAHQSLHKEVATLRESDESAVAVPSAAAAAAAEPKEKERPQPPPNPVKESKTFSYADAAKGKFRGQTVESGPPKEAIEHVEITPAVSETDELRLLPNEATARTLARTEKKKQDTRKARERRKMRLQSFRKALGGLDTAAREAFSRSSFKSKKEKKQTDVVESAKHDDVVKEHVEVEKCQSDVTVEPEPTKSDDIIIEQSQSAHSAPAEENVEEDTPQPAIKADEPVKDEEEEEEVVLPPPLPPKTISTLTEIDESTEKTSLRTLSLSEAILEELDLTLDSEEQRTNVDDDLFTGLKKHDYQTLSNTPRQNRTFPKSGKAQIGDSLTKPLTGRMLPPPPPVPLDRHAISPIVEEEAADQLKPIEVSKPVVLRRNNAKPKAVRPLSESVDYNHNLIEKLEAPALNRVLSIGAEERFKRSSMRRKRFFLGDSS